MKPTYHYSIIPLLITASLICTDKKTNVQDELAALKTITINKTDQTSNKIEELTKKLKNIGPVERLNNCLQCPEASEEQRLTAIRLFEKRIIRRYKASQLQQFLYYVDKSTLLLSRLTSILPKIISNEPLMERLANGDNLNPEDFEFVEKALATHESSDMVEKIFIAQIRQKLREKGQK